MNLDQINYVLLSKKEEDYCCSPLHQYYDVQSPVYSITSSKLCIAVLFLKDEEINKKSYQPTVAPSSILPETSHFIDSFWLVNTQKLLTFTVVSLQKEKKTMHVNPPICTAKGDYLNLFQYYHNESKKHIQDQIVHGLSLYNGSKFKIWEPFLTNVPNFIKIDIPNELKNGIKNPMRHLLMTVSKMKRTYEDKLSI